MGECGLKELGGRQYYCPVELALQVIGGKWKPLILHYLGEGRVLRFNELKRTIPSITQKMLTAQLRELEADGLVTRTVYAQVPPKVEYALSELGQSVMPVMRSLCEWGKGYEAALTARKKPSHRELAPMPPPRTMTSGDGVLLFPRPQNTIQGRLQTHGDFPRKPGRLYRDDGTRRPLF